MPRPCAVCSPLPLPARLPAPLLLPLAAAGKDVVVVGVRRIMPPAKHSRMVQRPRSRTLTSVSERWCCWLCWLLLCWA
jgi:hypothetical protein